MSGGSFSAPPARILRPIWARRYPRDRLLRLYKGETITEEGTFSGLLSGPSITVGYPVFYNSSFRVGVLLHASLPEVQQTFRDVYRLTVWAIILSIFIAYLILFFQIRKISTATLGNQRGGQSDRRRGVPQKAGHPLRR